MVDTDLIGKSGCRLLQRSGQICLGAQPAQVAQRGSLGVGSTLGAVPIGSHGPAGRSPGAPPGAGSRAGGAAGGAGGAYRNRAQGAADSERAALSHLRWLRSQADLPRFLQQAASRLTEQVGKDHRLPHAEDPLQDARSIVEAYLGLIEAEKPDQEPAR